VDPGEIVLLQITQNGGEASKLRPALILAILPGPYQTVLICGISTQLHQLEPDWDEIIAESDLDFAASGLHYTSAARLSYLYAARTVPRLLESWGVSILIDCRGFASDLSKSLRPEKGKEM
jgi:hypothetical protein